jgi:hypothetical protein
MQLRAGSWLDGGITTASVQTRRNKPVVPAQETVDEWG